MVESFREQIWRHRYIVGILAFCAGLMVYGIWVIGPHLMGPDEKAEVTKVLWMGVNRTPFIPDFKKGGNLYLYILALSFLPVYLYLKLTGRAARLAESASGVSSFYEASQPLQEAFFDFVVVARATSVVFGVATAFLVYVLARRVYEDEWTARIAALLLGTSLGFVNIAHFAAEDVVVAFFIVLSFILFTECLETPRVRNLVLTSGSIGLAVSAKATAGMLLLPLIYLLATDYWKDLRSVVTKSAISGLTVGFAYLATTPSILVFPELYVSELLYEIGNRYSPTTPEHAGWVIQSLNLARSFGLPLFLLVLVGTGVTARRYFDDRRRFDLLAFLFIGPMFLVVGSWENTNIVYIIPLMPFLSMFGAAFAVRMWERGTLLRIVLVSVLVFSLVYTGGSVYQYTTDPRIDASDWIDSEVPRGSDIDVYAHRIYQPDLPSDTDIHQLTFNQSGESFETARHRITLRCPDYVVLVSSHYERFLHHPDDYPEMGGFFEQLLTNETGYHIENVFGPKVQMRDTLRSRIRLTVEPRTLSVHPTVVVLARVESRNGTC